MVPPAPVAGASWSICLHNQPRRPHTCHTSQLLCCSGASHGLFVQQALEFVCNHPPFPRPPKYDTWHVVSMCVCPCVQVIVALAEKGDMAALQAYTGQSGGSLNYLQVSRRCGMIFQLVLGSQASFFLACRGCSLAVGTWFQTCRVALHQHIACFGDRRSRSQATPVDMSKCQTEAPYAVRFRVGPPQQKAKWTAAAAGADARAGADVGCG